MPVAVPCNRDIRSQEQASAAIAPVPVAIAMAASIPADQEPGTAAIPADLALAAAAIPADQGPGTAAIPADQGPGTAAIPADLALGAANLAECPFRQSQAVYLHPATVPVRRNEETGIPAVPHLRFVYRTRSWYGLPGLI